MTKNEDKMFEEKVKSIYIHIPFCSSICSYCDFCKIIYNKKIVNDYLLALKNEVNEKYKGEIIRTIYIGGGTPSVLSLEELNLLKGIISRIKLNKDYEFTFEMNIKDITAEKISFLKEMGVNRLSIGIESINEKFFDFLNRYNNKKDIIEKIDIVKNKFQNYSIDLMYAFPNETIQDLKIDLDFVTSFNPPHISIYSLIIEEHTKIYIDKTTPLDDYLEEEMYYYIIDYLKNKDYCHYEISNFAKNGYESKHNLVYWNNERYYGFGLGASGYIENFRYTNTRSMNKYLKGESLLEKEIMQKDILMENELILGLRKVMGVSKREFFNKYFLEIDQVFDIIKLLDEKLLVESNGYIAIPEDKLYVSNSILVNFIGGCKSGSKR